MTAHLKRFFRNESGATAMEHGMMVALFCVAVLFAAKLIGAGINNTFDVLRNTMSNGTQ